ncbi:venom serine protease [Scaptodrosophila lebanonensis]|uniref:Venom serine protease n=1 Tax=Drosophila lebanonensis TaxID=7225 RepID=A0A6J2T3T0_DROLE|nr:venom serine protease [Scaptodrosophila lebanonensis]
MSSNYLITLCGLVVLLVQLTASAYFAGCDNTYQLQPGLSYVESPYYPNNYPAGTSCRYKFVAPLDYYIKIQCNVNLPSTNGQCSTDNFYLDNEGDLLMRGSENFCGTGSFSRESLFTELVLAYISDSYSSGNFKCTLDVQPQPCSCGWSINMRIANGQQASINEFPSMVALKNRQSNQPSFCGGVIVSHRHIVSAAHCVLQIAQPSDVIAIVGTNNLQNPSSSRYYAQYNIMQILRHEQYQNDPEVVNDIAVLITSTTIKWTRGSGPVCLPPTGTTNDFTYSNVDVIGWGTLFFAGPTSATLQKITLMVVDNQVCQTEYNGIATINSGQICTYDVSGNARDSCQYDSGGPVIFKQPRHYLAGVISFGKDCAAGSYPMGVNTRITSYVPWIRNKIGNSNCVVSM